MNKYISNSDLIFKLYSILNSSFNEENWNNKLQETFYSKIIEEIFNMQRLSKGIPAIFKSYFSLVYEKILKGEDYSMISYSAIMNNSSSHISKGSINNFFSKLEEIKIVSIDRLHGRKSKVSINFNRLFDIFFRNEESVKESYHNENLQSKRNKTRNYRYATAKEKVKDIKNPEEMCNYLMNDCGFGYGESVIYTFLNTFYVRKGHEDYHITYADVMTLMSSILPYHKESFKSRFSWDVSIGNYLEKHEGLCRLVHDAIKSAKDSAYHVCKSIKSEIMFKYIYNFDRKYLDRTVA